MYSLVGGCLFRVLEGLCGEHFRDKEEPWLGSEDWEGKGAWPNSWKG